MLKHLAKAGLIKVGSDWSSSVLWHQIKRNLSHDR